MKVTVRREEVDDDRTDDDGDGEEEEEVDDDRTDDDGEEEEEGVDGKNKLEDGAMMVGKEAAVSKSSNLAPGKHG